MEHFAKSRFWRAFAVALVLALAYLGWSLSADRTLLPVAHAGGVGMATNGSFVFTTNELGDVLYVWPVTSSGGAAASYGEQWVWTTQTVTRKPFRWFDQPGVVPPGTPPGTIPPTPGGTPGGRYGGGERER